MLPYNLLQKTFLQDLQSRRQSDKMADSKRYFGRNRTDGTEASGYNKLDEHQSKRQSRELNSV